MKTDSATNQVSVRKRRWTILVACLLVVGVGMEIIVRLSGIVDFPTYDVDNEIGYVERPNQSGAFLRKNRWVFNDKSMPIAENWSSRHASDLNVLLIGNSIVMGGNPYDQPEKLAPLMNVSLGPPFHVWPIATGGWTNVNESAYLERNPDVETDAKAFVWGYMKGGSSALNRWQSDYTFPRTRPLFATWYVFRRYVLSRWPSLNTNELPPQGDATSDNMLRFETNLSKLAAIVGVGHGIIFLYPNEEQLLLAQTGAEWLPEHQEIRHLCEKYGLRVVDIARSPLWNASYYRDGTHPTVEGNIVLAKILSLEVRTALANAPQGTRAPGQ